MDDLLSLLALLLGVAVGLLLGRWLFGGRAPAGSLHPIQDALAALGAGTFDPQSLAPLVVRLDEVGQLARTIQGLVAALAAREHAWQGQLQEMRTDLDAAREARDVTASVMGRALRPLMRIEEAAIALEAGTFDPASLARVARRPDDIGELARVFLRMAREVQAREERLKQQVLEMRIEIDAVKQARAVSEITETDYFRELQEKVQNLRDRPRPGKE